PGSRVGLLELEAWKRQRREARAATEAATKTAIQESKRQSDCSAGAKGPRDAAERRVARSRSPMVVLDAHEL
ncbi:MAG: hypothetical protein ACKPKO_09470, partial [Candidatus Fonsibacter sp.]